VSMAAAITAAATIIAANIDVDPAPVAVYPIVDRESARIVDPTRLPFIVLRWDKRTPGQWGRTAMGRGRHLWAMAIYVYLGAGMPQSEEDEAAADALAFGYAEALADVLYANMTLNTGSGRTVQKVGGAVGETELFTEIRAGSLHWNQTRDLVGLRLTMPVRQDHAQEMSA